mgnify:CR=1 FL=1
MIETDLDSELRIAVHRASGEVTTQEILDAMNQWFGDPRFDAAIPVLWDFTDGMPMIVLSEIVALDYAFTNYVNEHRDRGRTAWVVTTGFGRALIDALYSERSFAAEWRTFMRREEALEWLLDQP